MAAVCVFLFVDPPIINLQKNIFFHEDLSGRHAAEAGGLRIRYKLLQNVRLHSIG
jgi:hypothetical protein